jgi:predicted Fe-Mo cluster-binding NifX family protein
VSNWTDHSGFITPVLFGANTVAYFEHMLNTPPMPTKTIAVSTNSDSQMVERFGHDFQILLLSVDGQEITKTEVLAPQAGCCRGLAQRIKGAEVLLCTGMGQGAARHLKDFGVDVAVVPEGVRVTTAITAWTAKTLPTGTAEPTACNHHGDAEHACGCAGDHTHDHEASCGTDKS